MSFNAQFYFFYGAEAKTIQKVAQEVLIAHLKSVLNAPESDLQALLEAPVTVTPIATTADAVSKGTEDRETGLPVVFVARGRRKGDSWGKTLDGTYYDGQRHELTFPLDMSINFADESDDVELCDAVCAAIEGREAELWNLGLTEIEITGDEAAQNAGVGRNPYLVTCAVYTLTNYNPA